MKVSHSLAFRVSFRFKANVKQDIIPDKLVQGVNEESCMEGKDIC